MTLPYERKNSLNWAREFLYELLDPKKTPRVPLAIRRRARSVLRHYPGEFYVEELAKKAPKLVGSYDDFRRELESK